MSEEINTIGIVGAGTMGNEIGKQAVLHDYQVRIFDLDQDALEEAKENVTETVKKQKDEKAVEKITVHDSLAEAVSNADLVIEAVPEDRELKRKVFSQIDGAAPPSAIIATNSSSLPVSWLEDAVERKDKVLNIHFYLPIQDRPMADIMKGTETSDETLEIGKEWVESLDCTPLIVKKESFGFIFNRIWHVIKKECLKIWANGIATPEVVDKAWKIFSGMNIGPFAGMDAVGLDVVYDIEMSYYEESGDPDDKPPEKLKEKIERGELGMKTGQGFYNGDET